jgi:uncharacterized protein
VVPWAPDRPPRPGIIGGVREIARARRADYTAGVPHILVFSRTATYRHESIPDGIRAFQQLGAEHGFTVEASEDPSALEGGFDPADVAHRYAAVVFLSTTGNVLTPAARDGLQAHCAAGGGIMGVHTATGTEGDWPFFGELIGARFASHPPIQPARVTVEDRDHPATRHLDAVWHLTDEWYEFTANPRGHTHVLASVDESSYQGGAMGADHPLVWCHEYGGARVFQTALGHLPEEYEDPVFRAHLLGGLTSVLRPDS